MNKFWDFSVHLRSDNVIYPPQDGSHSFDVSNSLFILPMNLSASMGRTLSPISGVLIAVSEIAEVSPIDIAKRNFIPIFITFVFLLILNFLL